MTELKLHSVSTLLTTPPMNTTVYSTTEVNNIVRVMDTQRIIRVGLYILRAEKIAKWAFLPILQAFHCGSELKHCIILHPVPYKLYLSRRGTPLHSEPSSSPPDKSLAAYLAAISFVFGHVIRLCNVLTLFEWNLNRIPQYYNRFSFFCVAYNLRITFHEKKTWKKSNLTNDWRTLTLFLNAHGLW